MHLFLYAISTDGGRGGGAVPGVASGGWEGWVSEGLVLVGKDTGLGLTGVLLGMEVSELVVHHRKTPWPG